MLLKEIYHNKIKHLDQNIQEALLKEAPHCRFVGEIPKELSFLRGDIVDLGFENLGLMTEKFNELLLAFAGVGVIVPGTHWKLRSNGPRAVVELCDGSESVSLPNHWSECVWVLGGDEKPSYVGSRVRKDQV